MKSRIGVKSGKCCFQIDQFHASPSPRNALAGASANRLRLASRAICLPKSFDSAMLPRTVRTSRRGCQSAGVTSPAGSGRPFSGTSTEGAGCAEATDNASVSAIFATCLGSQKQAGGSGCGSWSEIVREPRIKHAFLVSRQPSAVRWTPGPCPGSRVRIRPPSHSTTANSGGPCGRWARASSVLGSALRRSANSRPTSCTTRSMVLAETPRSPTSFITIAPRLKERVSAAATVIRCTNQGVSSRASKPNDSRRGEKAPAAAGAVTHRLLHGERAVDGGHPTFLAHELAPGTALGTLGDVGRSRGDLAHLACLNLPAELLPQFVRAGLDDRVMGDSHDRAVGLIEGHGNLRRLAQELIEFFLQSSRRPIHGLTPSAPRLGPPKLHSAALYHEIPRFSY